MSDEISSVNESSEVETPVESNIDENTESTNEEASLSSNNNTEKEIKQEIKRLKKLKIKYQGKEIEEELPFEIEDRPEAVEYMKKHLQMSKLANEKSQHASKLEKEVADFIDLLKKDPRKVLSDPTIGIDVKEMAAKIIEDEIAEASKSPEQIAKEKLERELAELKAEREREKKQKEEEDFNRIKEQQYQHYNMLMEQAFKENSLPNDPYITKLMADYMLAGLKEGKNISPLEIAPLIKQEFMSNSKNALKFLKDEELEDFLGNDIVEKLRKKRLQKAKEIQQQAVVKPKIDDVVKPKTDNNKSQDIKTYRDLFGRGI